jgi:hypothetical protein
MKTRQVGQQNIIGDLLDHYDNFKQKEENLLKNFARGRYMS